MGFSQQEHVNTFWWTRFSRNSVQESHVFVCRCMAGPANLGQNLIQQGGMLEPTCQGFFMVLPIFPQFSFKNHHLGEKNGQNKRHFWGPSDFQLVWRVPRHPHSQSLSTTLTWHQQSLRGRGLSDRKLMETDVAEDYEVPSKPPELGNLLGNFLFVLEPWNLGTLEPAVGLPWDYC